MVLRAQAWRCAGTDARWRHRLALQTPQHNETIDVFYINKANAQVISALSNFQCTVFLPDCWLVFRYRQQPTTGHLVGGFCGSSLSSSIYWDCYKIPSFCCTFQKHSPQFKGKVKVKFTPEQARKAEGASRDIALLFL